MKTLPLLLLFLFSGFSDKALEDGFYLTVDCALRGEIRRKNSLDEQKSVCLSPQPILSIHEIEAVSEIADSGIMSYFDLYISAKALYQFSAIRAGLKNTSIALVIDNRVLFVVDPDVELERVLRVVVYGNPDLRHVREKIVDQLAKG